MHPSVFVPCTFFLRLSSLYCQRLIRKMVSDVQAGGRGDQQTSTLIKKPRRRRNAYMVSTLPASDSIPGSTEMRFKARAKLMCNCHTLCSVCTAPGEVVNIWLRLHNNLVGSSTDMQFEARKRLLWSHCPIWSALHGAMHMEHRAWHFHINFALALNLISVVLHWENASQRGSISLSVLVWSWKGRGPVIWQKETTD